MRILYLGLPLGALHLDCHGHRPTMVLLAGGPAPGRRRVLRRLVTQGASVLEAPDLLDAQVRELIEAQRPDALLSFFWPRRIPEWLLALPRLGAYGTHPSLLPHHRGPDPYFWALRDGDEETGVTLHRLEEDYDVGDIVAQRTLRVAPHENAWGLARKLDTPALTLLAWAAAELERGTPLPGEAQHGEVGRWARQPTEEDLKLDWTLGCDDLERLVRAASPWPGASARVGDHWVEVLAAEPAIDPPPAALHPAEAYDAGGRLAVVCGDGALVITRAREEDVERSTAELRAYVDL